MCLLCIAVLGGLPQISLPLATFDGLPWASPWSARGTATPRCWTSRNGWRRPPETGA